MLHIKGTAVLDTLEALKARWKNRIGQNHFSPGTGNAGDSPQPIPPSSWYSCDAFARFLEADVRESAGGNEQELVKRAEAVIEKQLSGIYKMFVRLARRNLSFAGLPPFTPLTSTACRSFLK